MKKMIVLLLIMLATIMVSVASVSADPASEVPRSIVKFRMTGYVSGDPFSLGLEGESFTADIAYDTGNLSVYPTSYKIFPVEWLYKVGPYQLTTEQAAINLDDDLYCDDPENPACVFDGWQVVDEMNPVEGQIGGYNVVGMALNFQDHDATALDAYDITEPLNLDDWEVHNGTINLEGLEGEIFVEVETFNRISLAPVPPGGMEEPVGLRLHMLGNGGDWGDIQYAGLPFHIMHGYSDVPLDVIQTHNIKFELEVDGNKQIVDFGSGSSNIIDGEKVVTILWGYNFPDGFFGNHEFIGRWYAPCSYAVEIGYHPGPCPDPNEKTEVHSETITINFVE